VPHPFPGFSGLALGPGVFAAVWCLTYFTKAAGPFNLDPLGEKGKFEPFLAKYLRVAEFLIGLATGSIVLLVGSSALHGQGGQLPWFYASPLLLLAWCVIWGIGFMVWLIFNVTKITSTAILTHELRTPSARRWALAHWPASASGTPG
jgi:hypothetical protein